jgi:two-component system sensor histidine kinase UhpB
MGLAARAVSSRSVAELLLSAGRAFARAGPPRSLFWRVFFVNAGLLILAALVLALSPATVSAEITPRQALVLTTGVAAVLAANVILLRISFAPLRDLVRFMRRVDLLAPGKRLEVEGARELTEVATTFNHMLDRLELERRASSSRSLDGNEAERRRIATELHDEVGQGLTALLLQLRTVIDAAPDSLRPRLVESRTLVRTQLDEVRRIAHRLRPTVLDELGLSYALLALADVFERSTEISVVRRVDTELPRLPPLVELALYRIAQEALTNAARHADASSVELMLCASMSGCVALTVRDDGRGMLYAVDLESGGMRGMRERALAIDADFSVQSRPGQGTSVLVSAASE